MGHIGNRAHGYNLGHIGNGKHGQRGIMVNTLDRDGAPWGWGTWVIVTWAVGTCEHVLDHV